MVEPIFMKNDDFFKVSKLRTSIQRIVLNHSRLWKPSRKLVRTFLTPKILDLELQTTRVTSESTASPEFVPDMKSTYLEVSGTMLTFSPEAFFRVQKSRKFHDFDTMCPTLTEKYSSTSSRIAPPLFEQQDIMNFFANRCGYSTLHCFITMKITKT